MTKASSKRVDKKLKDKKKKPHQTHSFAQMVSQAQLNALKPYIEEVVQQTVQLTVAQNMQHISRLVLNHISQVQTRQLAVEKLLDLDKEKLSFHIAEIEDDAFGFETKEGMAEKGDKVRVEVQSKAEDEDAFGESEKVLINSLLSEDVNGNVQTLKELEEGILGLKSGETKEIVLPSAENEEKGSVMKIKVIRVSSKIEKEEEKKSGK